MTYKSIIQILLILAIISTICISIMKPKMHNPVMIYDSQFSVDHDDGIKVDEQNIAVLVQDTEVNQNNSFEVENNTGINFVEPKVEDVNPITFSKNEIKSENTAKVQNQKINSSKNVKIAGNNTGTKTTSIKTNNNSIQSVPVKNQTQTQTAVNNQSPKIDLNKIVNNNQKIINNPAQTVTSPVKSSNSSVVNTPVTTYKPSVQIPEKVNNSEPKTPANISSQTTSTPQNALNAKTESKPVVLTAAQEEIAWNKWRSNLNNQIMKDSKLPTMPNGIIFKYKFTVDKYGKVSNVQTSSTTPGYTPYAIQFIAPVIRSYQGRSILNFPAGSKREFTEVSGAWKISSNSKLSTPDDFNDIEKIKK